MINNPLNEGVALGGYAKIASHEQKMGHESQCSLRSIRFSALEALGDFDQESFIFQSSWLGWKQLVNIVNTYHSYRLIERNHAHFWGYKKL